MDPLDEENTSEPLLLDLRKIIHPSIHEALVHVLTVLQHYPLSPPLWEMTTFVRVELQSQNLPVVDFTQMTHSGMVRVVEPPPAVS